MSVVKAVGRGVFWNTAGVIGGKVLILINIVIILSHLTVYDYGLVELVLSSVSIAGLFTLSGLSSIIIADLSVERARGQLGMMKSIFLQFSLLNFGLGMVMWAVFFFGAPYVAGFVHNISVAPLLQIVSFSFLVSPFRIASQTLASVHLRYADQALYGVVEEVWKFLCLAVFVMALRLGPAGLLITIVVSQLLAAATYSYRTWTAYHYFGGARATDPAAFWHMLMRHRTWGIAIFYVSSLTQNFRIWLIKLMLGTEAVGIFAFVFGIFGNITSLLPLGTVLAPLFPRFVDEKERLVRIIRTSVKAQSLLAVCFVVAALPASPVFIHLLFPKYAVALPALYAMLLSIVPNGILTIFTPAFAAYKQQRSLFFGNAFKSLLTFILLAPCLAFFGVAGASLEIALSTLGTTLERYIRLKRFIPGFSLRARDFFSLDAEERRIVRGLLKKPTLSEIRALILDFS